MGEMAIFHQLSFQHCSRTSQRPGLRRLSSTLLYVPKSLATALNTEVGARMHRPISKSVSKSYSLRCIRKNLPSTYGYISGKSKLRNSVVLLAEHDHDRSHELAHQVDVLDEAASMLRAKFKLTGL
jgi:hypothetical protein